VAEGKVSMEMARNHPPLMQQQALVASGTSLNIFRLFAAPCSLRAKADPTRSSALLMTLSVMEGRFQWQMKQQQHCLFQIIIKRLKTKPQGNLAKPQQR
jgi:hypothetical protein